MQNLWKCVIYFAVISSILNVVISSKITIHIDDAGVKETAPTCKFKTGWSFVEQDATFSGITDAGVLGSIQKWLKMQAVEFENLSRNDVEQEAGKSETSGEVDIWADGLGHYVDKHSVLTERTKGPIARLSAAVETHVAGHLVAEVFNGKMPKKVKFGVARRDYFTSFDGPVGGIHFRVILKKVDEKAENTVKPNGNADQAGARPPTDNAGNANTRRNSGNGH